MAGYDAKLLSAVDSNLILKRVTSDFPSDFIIAPQFNRIYRKAGAELWERVSALLRSGKYQPSPPITLSVPKGRGFTRPGSILNPVDRVIYQMLADKIAPTVESNLDRDRVFSNKLLEPDPLGRMFAAQDESWRFFRAALQHLCDGHKYVVKADIANFFERVPQHACINMLTSANASAEAVSLLEELLLAFRERQSVGLLQGMFPSDLLGNFHLSSVDAQCEILGIPSIRYIDDFYLGFDSYFDARVGLAKVIEELRKRGLHLNEWKSSISRAEKIIGEETALEKEFSNILEGLNASTVDQHFATLYDDFWGEDEDELNEESSPNTGAEAIVVAVERLLFSTDFKDATKVDRFCIPILGALESDAAIDRAIRGIRERPHLARTYRHYLKMFVYGDQHIVDSLVDDIDNNRLADFELMHAISVLNKAKNLSRTVVTQLAKLVIDSKRHESVRALAGIAVCKFGSSAQRNSVRLRYQDEQSPFVRSALLYGAQYFPTAERRSCKQAWSGHSIVNELLAPVIG